MKDAAEQEAREADKATPKPTAKKATTKKPAAKKDDGIVTGVVNSGAFRDFMRTATREIVRGMFKTGRR